MITKTITTGTTSPEIASILSDPVRCGPVLAVRESGAFDNFKIQGSSARIRDLRSGYFFFVINNEADIAPLTNDIVEELRFAIAVNEEFETEWKRLFPKAVCRRMCMAVAKREWLADIEDVPLPEGYTIVRMDETWDELVIDLFSDGEFTPAALSHQLRTNQSLGLLFGEKRVGFISMHLNGEIGPVWISAEHRGGGLGTLFLGKYIRELTSDKETVYALFDPSNMSSSRMGEKAGFKMPDKCVLHITVMPGGVQ